MSETSKVSNQSALDGARFSGLIEVAEDGLVGMISLRCDLNARKVASAVESVLGLAMPAMRAIVYKDKGESLPAMAWMSPDEALILCDYTRVEALMSELENALTGEHVLVANVSDARAVFTLRGAAVRDILAKGTPYDISPNAFGVGEVARSRLGQVAVAFWLSDKQNDSETVHLVCFRSLATYVFDWLSTAASEGGAVGFYD